MAGLNIEQLSMDAVEETELALRGEDVNVVFSMPDGQRHRHTVRAFTVVAMIN
jgi:hypothetical protein